MYYSFSEKGEIPLPSKEACSELISKGVKPIVFLDSCVCLHIIKKIDHKHKATNIDKVKVANLKEYLSRTPVSVNPLFGLMELCYKEGNFDKSKFWDFNHRIDFFKQMPVSYFNGSGYDFTRDYFGFEHDLGDRFSPFYGFESYFYNSYCALLKIRELATNDVSKKAAQKNCISLLDWMANDLGVILGTEYQLGIRIFGGDTNFRKMVWLEGKIDQVKKKVLGTAWDFFHARQCTNNAMLSKGLNENLSAFFVTSDNNLFKLFQQKNLSLVVDAGKGHGISSISSSNSDLPHLDHDFLEIQNKKLIELFLDRALQELKWDRDKTKAMIVDLESRIVF